MGGADGDLLVDGMLVDVKVAKDAGYHREDWDQLLGYLLLAREHRRQNKDAPEVDRVGIYYARHGCVWEADAAAWTGRPGFAELEAWFFDLVRQKQQDQAARYADAVAKIELAKRPGRAATKNGDTAAPRAGVEAKPGDKAGAASGSPKKQPKEPARVKGKPPAKKSAAKGASGSGSSAKRMAGSGGPGKKPAAKKPPLAKRAAGGARKGQGDAAARGKRKRKG